MVRTGINFNPLLGQFSIFQKTRPAKLITEAIDTRDVYLVIKKGFGPKAFQQKSGFFGPGPRIIINIRM